MAETQNTSDVVEYKHGSKEPIVIVDHPKVWSPTKYVDFFMGAIDGLDLEGEEVLDFGVGSGILAIEMARRGASVTVSDYNTDALVQSNLNATVNGVSFNESVLSDRFKGFSSGLENRFKYIICNTPGLPGVDAGTKERPDALAWNMSGNDGREVLDANLQEAMRYLKPGGQLIVGSGSQQGWGQTEQQLNKHWGKNNWDIHSHNVMPLSSRSTQFVDHWLKNDRVWVQKDPKEDKLVVMQDLRVIRAVKEYGR
ncbi:MAG: methyltransferase [Alphaproteobacteria bacterium]|nr:methyltransferase [Alphaproteobacteria bacterium]